MLLFLSVSTRLISHTPPFSRLSKLMAVTIDGNRNTCVTDLPHRQNTKLSENHTVLFSHFRDFFVDTGVIDLFRQRAACMCEGVDGQGALASPENVR